MTVATDTFLVELGTEELPPTALRRLGESFAAGIRDGLAQQELGYDQLNWYASPRRLAVVIEALAVKQEDREMERRGPAVKAAFDQDGNPTKAAQGFAGSCGVSVDQLERMDTPKGEWLVYRYHQTGEATEKLLPGIVEQSLNKLPIPKRMIWGASHAAFVRPVHWLVMLQGDQVIPCELLEQQAGSVSRGHRFMSEGEISIPHAKDYLQVMEQQGKVIADYERRKQMILEQVQQLSRELKAEAEIDEDLLEEVTGLVEWPVALAGNFDESFLEVPPEALVSAMKEHQKYFPVRDQDGRLLPLFITISNIQSPEPQKIVSGNEKVIRPRLADAQFFFNTDKKQPLEAFNERLQNVVFQQKLGTVKDKAERVAKLAQQIANAMDANGQQAFRAGQLSKADLATEMVGEFPELQGIMGHYYALANGEDEAVADAIAEQYQPRFADDALPASLVGASVSLAEKLDTLTGIFAIGQKPSGDKDPFALRRAALGTLKILIQKTIDLDLGDLVDWALQGYHFLNADNAQIKQDVLQFFFDRYRPYYQQEGIDTDVIQAVEALRPIKPLDFHQRVEAVKAFKALDAAQTLAAANKRVSNILKKTNDPLDQTQFDSNLLSQEEEKRLADAVAQKRDAVAPLLQQRDYSNAMASLAELRDQVDAFFDNVMVNVDDAAQRVNRLLLLQSLQTLFLQVADISLLKAES